MVAQTKKVLFLCNCCSTTHVPSLNDQILCNGTTGRTKEAECRQNHCQGGGTMVATAIVQWTLLVGQRRHNGGTRKAEASLKSIHNVHNSTHLFTGRPMADHCASIQRPRRCVCLPPASFERPVSDRPPRWLFWTCSRLYGDHGVHGDIWTSCVPPLCDQGNRTASFLPSTAAWPVLWPHKRGTKVAAPV